MAEENEKPRYKKTPYLGLIIAIVAIVVTIILAIWQYSPPPSDFSISVKPMRGEVHQGGVITTAITIKGIQGYEHPVRLGASGQPEGIVLSLVPLIGGPTPSYTSTVTIIVDSTVPAGDYEIVKKGRGADGKEHSCIYTLTVKPSVTPTSIATHSPTTLCIIDKMDNTSSWRTYKDGDGSSINIESISGRIDKALEISYDLKERGWVEISKKINPTILSEKKGIKFFYKGSGKPNTIELKLIYGDVGGTTFGVLWNRATAEDNWVSFEVPYSSFDCWWPEDNCLLYGNEIDLNKVRKIEFAISNKPEDGDLYGSGKVIIDDVQGI